MSFDTIFNSGVTVLKSSFIEFRLLNEEYDLLIYWNKLFYSVSVAWRDADNIIVMDSVTLKDGYDNIPYRECLEAFDMTLHW